MSTPDMAFIQDWLVDFGGAERCLEALSSEYPSAPIHTLFYDHRQFSDSAIAAHPIQTSFLDKPFFKKRYRLFLALYPLAIEQLDIGSPQVVVTFSHSVAHGAIVRADTLHICYCHTPVRYAWDLYHSYLRLSGLTSGPRSWAARSILHYLRLWDSGAAGRVDRWVANSRNVARRILRVYGKESAVIYPPVDVGRFAPAKERGDAFLVVGRMVPYKRADLAVVACTRLGLPLRVVGDGPELSKLNRLAGPTVQFLGRLDDRAVAEEMARARALLFCGEEDFGITPVEAQAAGTPVIAYGKGGALETINAPEQGDYDNATGLFFPEPTSESLAEAMIEFDKNAHRFGKAVAVRNAARFDTRRYVNEMKALVESEWEAFRGRR
jgi:glycosyltransferase involved in cell wall biosynthesis